MNGTPEFDAYEINKLNALARKSDYYRKAHKFVMDFVDGKLTEYATLTINQKKWLWGIKADLREKE